MILDLKKDSDSKKFNDYSENLKKKNAKVEIREVRDARTLKQNSALHLFFTMIANELNELGTEFTYLGVKGLNISVMYTPHIVKEFFWKPIQLTLFDIKSTSKLNTDQINKIIDIVCGFFADKGVVVAFPNIEDLIKKNNTIKN